MPSVGTIRPAEMTICMGAICSDLQHRSERAVVVASDRMVTMGGLQEFEHEVPKVNEIGDCVVALVAGDALKGNYLVRAVRATVTAAGNVRGVADSAADRYAELRHELVDASVFGPRGITLSEFYRGLQPTMLAQLVGGLDQQVAALDPGLELLIAGVDDEGGHLFQIGNPGGRGSVVDFAPIGFGAIGSGALHAIQAMIVFGHAPARGLNDTIFRVFAAKRRAEVAPGVGHDTDLLVITDDGVTKLPPEALAILQSIYDDYNRPIQAELDKKVREATFVKAKGA